jgi:hypothetical protein
MVLKLQEKSGGRGVPNVGDDFQVHRISPGRSSTIMLISVEKYALLWKCIKNKDTQTSL